MPAQTGSEGFCLILGQADEDALGNLCRAPGRSILVSKNMGQEGSGMNFGMDLPGVGNDQAPAPLKPTSRVVVWSCPRLDGDPMGIAL